MSWDLGWTSLTQKKQQQEEVAGWWNVFIKQNWYYNNWFCDAEFPWLCWFMLIDAGESINIYILLGDDKYAGLYFEAYSKVNTLNRIIAI